jgi:hypothetical protein
VNSKKVIFGNYFSMNKVHFWYDVFFT